MGYRKNKDLHVVRSPEEQTDKLVDRIMAELKNEDISAEELDEQVKEHKKKRRQRIVIGAVSVLAAAVAIFLLIHLQTYTSVRVTDTYESVGTADGNYKQFAGGVLKYSRDGISYFNQKGEEKWNQPYQIKNPFVEVNDTSGVIADKGGNSIYVFREDGVRGEIHTTLPIQKLAVSEQGIVCAILKNESAPKIICYDTAGNILVEHKTSTSGTGYPLDVSVSPDGEVMQVLYLYTQAGKTTSRIVYYNFGEAGEGKTDRQVAYTEYEGTVMAEGFFMSQSISAAVGDNLITIYKGKAVPEEVETIKPGKDIKSVFHSDKYIGLILESEGAKGYELRLYNTSGKQVMSENFTGDYNNVKICGSQIVMYGGKQCCVFMRTGIKKFEGDMENQILEIFPTTGVNKYIVMNTNGMEKVRFVK